MSQILADFWMYHKPDNGWGLATEMDAGYVKAVITLNSRVVVTAYAYQKMDDPVEKVEKVAMERAINRLNGKFE